MVNSIISIENHTKGFTCLNYDDKLDYVLTGGTDGHIKAWSDLTNTVVFNYQLSAGINCIISEKDRIFIASASNRIESFSIIDKNNKAVLSQFASNVNYLQLNVSQSKLVACSDDFSVKLINLQDEGRDKRETVFDGHDAPVMSVAINCRSELMASSSCDGCIIVWDVDSKRVLKSLQLLEVCKDICDVTNYCRLKWSLTDAKKLFIPLNDEIRIIDCDSWRVDGNFKWSDKTSKNVTELALSADEKYLAAGTIDGWILVWHIKTKKLVFNWQNSRKSSICCVLWHPKRDETLLFTDESGFYEALKIVLEQVNDDESDAEIYNAQDIEGLFDEDDFPQNEKKILDKKVNIFGTLPLCQGIDDFDTVFSEDEEAEVSISDLKSKFMSPAVSESGAAPEEDVTTTKIIHVERQPHAPVMSTCCPRSGHDQLMLWNTVAAIKNHFDDNGDSGFLEVDFQNVQTFRNLIYRHNVAQYDLADVNERALMLVSKATDGSDDDDDGQQRPAQIHVRPLNSIWSEFNIELPARENPIACCLVGEDYGLVLTNRCLRCFHAPTGGLQLHIESMPGTPVAMAASTNEGNKRVIIVLDDGHQLVWRLEQFDASGGRLMEGGKMTGSKALTSWHPLPLSASSTLVWIGFSDSSSVYCVDSKQIVRRLLNVSMNVPRWAPVLDLRNAMEKSDRSTDRYFPIGFVDRTEQRGAMVVHCRGSRYPKTVPWPHLTLIPFQAPLCSPKSETSQLEQSMLLNHLVPDWTIATADDIDVLEQTEKQLLLKLFANAVVQVQDTRAFNIAKLMPDSNLIQLAIRFAVSKGKQILAKRLGELALEKDEEMKQQMTDMDNDDGDTEGGEEEIEKENSSHAFNQSGKVHDLLREKSLEQQYQVDIDADESPFRVLKNVGSNSRRTGTDVFDKIEGNDSNRSPQKVVTANSHFGSFVPIPGDKTVKISKKRKSVKPFESPLAKMRK